jgi:hypothetical protein
MEAYTRKPNKAHKNTKNLGYKPMEKPGRENQYNDAFIKVKSLP